MAPARKRSASEASRGCITWSCAASKTATLAPDSAAGTGVRVATTTTTSVAAASWRCAVREAGLGTVTVTVRLANPRAETCTWYSASGTFSNQTVPSPAVMAVCRAGPLFLSSDTWAPETAADWGSTTLSLRSAANDAAKYEQTKSRAQNARIPSSFTRERVAVDGLRRSPGLRVRMRLGCRKNAAIGQHPIAADGLPGHLPVTGCYFLAYSCAAARDFHPLPCLCRNGKDAQIEGILKEQEKTGVRNLPREVVEVKFLSCTGLGIRHLACSTETRLNPPCLRWRLRSPPHGRAIPVAGPGIVRDLHPWRLREPGWTYRCASWPARTAWE